ncbi:uncharacterized protein PV09_02337 [Verruconis gallopava]|uniref:Dolichyl-diphosphooligosaccharide--protein glycosyltransferase subunit 4 n=1 Tax=Verruconis gallopava TaxID=253628 RepID=A0A0D2AJ94_9PEZI|nr:uncharacterized protein PV09_02337 [Verruconis gallopava]KIW06625.1 hypothetical protein PV09_02337 [Verruconis gallopava]
MISDNQLYTLALFLGSASMLLIVLYHWLEINAKDEISDERKSDAIPAGTAKEDVVRRGTIAGHAAALKHLHGV